MSNDYDELPRGDEPGAYPIEIGDNFNGSGRHVRFHREWEREGAGETARDDLTDLRLRRVELMRDRRRLLREIDDLERIVHERDHQLREIDEQIEAAEALMRSRP